MQGGVAQQHGDGFGRLLIKIRSVARLAESSAAP